MDGKCPPRHDTRISWCYYHPQGLAVLGQLINTLNWVQAVVTGCEFLLILGFPRGGVLWEDFEAQGGGGNCCLHYPARQLLQMQAPWLLKEPTPLYLGSNLPRYGASRRARPVPVYGHFFNLWAHSLMRTSSFKLADGHLGQWSQLKIPLPLKQGSPTSRI